jgi:type III pantothenate kinase
MADTVLLIDQGNTRLKWVLAHNGEIDEESGGHGDLYVLGEAIRSMPEFRPGSVTISSVAGLDKAQQLADFCRTHWRITVRFLESKAEQGGVRNAYDEPASLGVDRWLAIVGAVHRFGTPVVIWDLGTATTLDAVDEQGLHLGGLIFPGPETMLEALRQNTKLPVPRKMEAVRAAGTFDLPAGDRPVRPGVSPGRNTAECIGQGVLASQLGALNQFLRNAALQMERQPGLVVTGGAAGPVLSLIEFDCIHDPWLVFRGMLV